VRGRRIPDKKIEQAGELRARGFSLREIARRLHISKSSADRFGQGISPEQSEELQEDSPDQPTGETLAEQGVSQNVSGQEKSVPDLLYEQLYYISECAISAAKLGDKAGVEMAMREFQQVRREADDYFRSISPSIPYPSPYLSPNRTETVRARSEHAISKYVRIRQVEVIRKFAAIQQDQQKESAAILRAFQKDHERELSRLTRNHGE